MLFWLKKIIQTIQTISRRIKIKIEFFPKENSGKTNGIYRALITCWIMFFLKKDTTMCDSLDSSDCIFRYIVIAAYKAVTEDYILAK